jgi:small-conductance mechanosensitive channel
MLSLQTATSVVETALDRFVSDVVGALPDVLAGVVFLGVAFLVVRTLTYLVGRVLRRAMAGEEPVYRQFVTTVVAVFLWFGVALSFLSIVGLDAIAASLGTATGFLALGVSYALSGMIADAVAGVYLLRDPDFMPGDRVDVGGTVGEVKSIELRKTRLRVEDDTVVRANAEIEKKWTKLDDAD